MFDSPNGTWNRTRGILMSIDPNCVLVVDDDSDVRTLVADMLAHAKYEPVCASSGQQAVAMIEDKKPAVAIVDLLLEDIPGLAVMREIKKLSPATECIVVTGQASHDACVAAVNLGAYGFHQKPFETAHMLATIRAAVQRGEEAEALKAERDFYQGITEHLPCALALSDADGIVRYVNPAFKELTGIDSDDILGTPPPYPWTDNGILTRDDGKEVSVQVETGTIAEEDDTVCTLQTFHLCD